MSLISNSKRSLIYISAMLFGDCGWFFFSKFIYIKNTKSTKFIKDNSSKYGDCAFNGDDCENDRDCDIY